MEQVGVLLVNVLGKRMVSWWSIMVDYHGGYIKKM